MPFTGLAKQARLTWVVPASMEANCRCVGPGAGWARGPLLGTSAWWDPPGPVEAGHSLLPHSLLQSSLNCKRLPHSLLQSSLNCGGGGACSGAHPSADRRGDGGPENQASCPPGAPWGNLELGGRSGGHEVDAASACEPVDFENCPQALELAWQ